MNLYSRCVKITSMHFIYSCHIILSSLSYASTPFLMSLVPSSNLYISSSSYHLMLKSMRTIIIHNSNIMRRLYYSVMHILRYVFLLCHFCNFFVEDSFCSFIPILRNRFLCFCIMFCFFLHRLIIGCVSRYHN